MLILFEERIVARRLIEKARDRLAREVGTVYKSHAGNVRFALAFPNTYYVGMSSLGFQTVYRVLNGLDGAVCERTFLPDPPELEDVRRTGAPLLTMESQTPVRDFDVLAFSVSYELDYVNLLRVLSLSRLDLTADERERGQPLVLAGGPAVTFNPEPLAPFVDAFVIGEAEEVLPELVNVLYNKLNVGRTESLKALSGIEGVYVPRFYRPVYRSDGMLERVDALEGAPPRVKRRWVPELESYDATTAILTPETEFSNMVLAEVARGCGRQCRFCIAGYAFLPPRARAAERVLAGIHRTEEKAQRRSIGHPRIGLVGASVFDHPSSLLVCRSLVERNRLFSISSLRADTLNRDIAETLHRGGHETLTIAPEAGSERLRLVLNKPMSDEEILGAAAIAWDGGFRRLKLYFMVGLPTETPEDVGGIASLVTRIAAMFRWRRVTASVSCFVPKPWTPFQWAPMEEQKRLAEKLGAIRRALRPLKSVTVGGESAREAVVQGVLARGDRRLRDVLLAAHGQELSWRMAFRESGTDPHFYAQRPRHEKEVFPWDHIDLGVRKDYLWREYERAMDAAPTPACVVRTCRRCGVCHG